MSKNKQLQMQKPGGMQPTPTVGKGHGVIRLYRRLCPTIWSCLECSPVQHATQWARYLSLYPRLTRDGDGCSASRTQLVTRRIRFSPLVGDGLPNMQFRHHTPRAGHRVLALDRAEHTWETLCTIFKNLMSPA
jgi:hypothetical protein